VDTGRSRRIAVIGGGISGLAAAYELASSFDVVLLESNRSTGGLVRTFEFRGHAVDGAADVFITRTPDAEELARELGLAEDLAEPATSSASVFARGATRPMPAGLVLGVPTDLGALWRSGIVSRRSVLRAAGDLVDPRRSRASRAPGSDPTIAEVFEPRLGHEVFANLVDPLLGGINAGDARELSLAAAAPVLAEATARASSVIRALRPLAVRRTTPDGSAPLFLGLSKGMASLTEALARACERRGVEIRPSIAATRIGRGEGALVRVETPAGDLRVDGAVVALPAWACARLVRSLSSALADALDAIPYASVATITSAYALEGAAGRAPFNGSGVLVPRGDALTTAFTFVSTKWPRTANDGEFLLRASVGRRGDERALALDDDELERRVRVETATVLGIDAPPLATRIERFVDAFPQYVSGHRGRCDRIARLAAALGPIVLTGSWSMGIGLPACIASARDAARTLGGRLQ
jgi:protoporphyrinogen/coproporphyrinogen III oxidase